MTFVHTARRLALAACLVVSSLAFAKAPESCEDRCSNDAKDCNVQCAKKAGKNAGACKSACAQLTDPCRAECKRKEEKKKK